MAGRREVRAIGPSYQLADSRAAVQRTVNMYLQPIEAEGEPRRWVLNSCPGLNFFVSFGAGDWLGVYSTGTRLFTVKRNPLGQVDVYENTAGTYLGRGFFTSSAPYVRMAYGRDQLVIVDGTNGWVLNLATNAFSQITDVDWRGSYDVEFLDGYFCFIDPNSSDQFYISAIDDATDLDALDFSSADVMPDDLITLRAHKRELFLFGRRSLEIWVNSPSGAGFPFVRLNSVPVDIGIVGRRAVTRGADTLAFVGQTERGRAAVYLIEGHQPRPISNRAVEEALLASDVTLSDCVMWAYQKAGVEFIGLEAPGMKTTWVYNARTQQWHEWAKWDEDAAEFEPVGVFECVVFGSDELAATVGGLWKIDGAHQSFQTDPTGTPINTGIMVRERTWPHMLNAAAEPVSYRSIELICKTGELQTERTIAQAQSEAQCWLQISNDGGRNWGPKLFKKLGAEGRYDERIRWNFLGSARDRVFRIGCSDDVDFAIYDVQVDAT